MTSSSYTRSVSPRARVAQALRQRLHALVLQLVVLQVELEPCLVVPELVVALLLVDEPALVNTSPEADGWMAKVKLSDESELDGLMVRAAIAASASASAQTAPSLCSQASLTLLLAFLRPSMSAEASPPTCASSRIAAG